MAGNADISLETNISNILFKGGGRKQLALLPDTPSAKCFRNVFGYVAFIKPADSEGA